MKRVEFFGPMGAGKSTLHNKLAKSNLLGKDSIAKNEVYRILLHQVNQHSFFKYLFLRIILDTPIKHRVFSNYDFHHYLKDNEAATRLIQFILKEVEIEKSNDKAKTLVRLNFLLKDLADVVVLQKHSNKKLIVHDESLVQRGLSFALDKTLEKLESYFDNSILPDAVIYVRAPLETLKKRVQHRSKTNIGFLGNKAHSINQVEDSYAIAERIAAILEKRTNTKVLRIDTESNSSSNALKIIKWIKTI